MDFPGVTIDQALTYYRKHHPEAFSKIKEDKQTETLIKQLDSIIFDTNKSLMRKFDEALFKHVDIVSEASNEYVERNPIDREVPTKRKYKREAQTVSNKLNFVDLPNEIIAYHILSCTDVKSRFSVAQSCRLMSDLIHDVVGYEFIRIKCVPDILKILKYKGIVNNTTIALDSSMNNTLYSLLAGCRHIQTSQDSLIEINDSDLKAIGLAGVHTLNIGRCANVSDDGIKALRGIHSVNLSGTGITDEGLKELAGVHTINLGDTGITNEGLKALEGVHNVDLFRVTTITDEGLQALKGVHTIDLAYTTITDEGLQALEGVHTINLDGTSITDEGLKYLKGVHAISLESIESISDKGLKALAGVHKIDLGGTSITDEGVKYLRGVHTIDLNSTSVTDNGLKSLTGVHTINLNGTSITDEGLKYLKGVHTVYLRGTSVTDEGIKSLTGVHTIDLTDTLVTDEGLKHANTVILSVYY